MALRDRYIRDDQPATQQQAVPSSSLVEFERLVEERLQQAADQIEVQELDKDEAYVRENGWTNEDSLLAAQRFFSSSALGWGDEAALWVSAAINANITYPYYDLETTTKEQYNKLKKEYDAKQREFAERNKGAALTADISGGFASPAMLLKAATTAGRVGLSALEGGIYGAGAAEEGQRIEDAQTGALFGGGGTALFSAIGKVGSQFYKRRIEGDLVDKDGDFVPLTLAASKPDGIEGAIHTFYRDIVSPSFGGKGLVRQQERKIIDKVEDVLESKKAFDAKLKAGLKEAETKSKQMLSDAVAKNKDELNESLREARASAGRKGSSLEAKLSAYRSKKPEEIASKAIKLTNDALDSSRFNFRSEVFTRSTPAGATQDDLAKIFEKQTPGEMARELDKLWGAKGYSMIKNKKFRFKRNELEQAISNRIANSPYLQVDVTSNVPVMKIFNQVVDNVKAFKDPNSRITGEKASEIRAQLGTLAYRAGDDQMKFSLYGLQNELDEVIKSQLTPSQLRAFQRESDKWKTTVILRDAIEKAQTTTKRGAFDESDWIKSVSRNNKWDNRYASGPLNQKARALELDHKAIEKSISRRAKAVALQKASNIQKTIADHNDELKRNLDRLKSEAESKKLKLRDNPEFAQDIAIANRRIQEIQSEISVVESRLKTLNELKSSPNPSWFYTLAASGILGSYFGGPVGAVGSVGAAYGIGRALSQPSAQKAIAGQLPAQQAIQRLMDADKTGRTAEILERAGGVAASRGMLTEQ